MARLGRNKFAGKLKFATRGRVPGRGFFSPNGNDRPHVRAGENIHNEAKRTYGTNGRGRDLNVSGRRGKLQSRENYEVSAAR